MRRGIRGWKTVSIDDYFTITMNYWTMCTYISNDEMWKTADSWWMDVNQNYLHHPSVCILCTYIDTSNNIICTAAVTDSIVIKGEWKVLKCTDFFLLIALYSATFQHPEGHTLWSDTWLESVSPDWHTWGNTKYTRSVLHGLDRCDDKSPGRRFPSLVIRPGSVSPSSPLWLRIF